MKKRISLSSELRLSSDSLRSTQDTPRIVPVVPIELPPFIERKKPLRYTVEVEKINHYLLFASTQKTKITIQKNLPLCIQFVNQLWDLLTCTQPVPIHTISCPQILSSALKEISDSFDNRDIELTVVCQKNQKIPPFLLNTLSNHFNVKTTHKQNVLNLSSVKKNTPVQYVIA